MQKVAIIAIAVVAVLAIGGGAGFAIYNALKDTSETDSTIVGHEFEYKVVGNYEDKTLGGTQKVTILSEDDTKYEVKTVRNIYAETSLGSRTILYDDSNTEWKIKDDITKPGTFSKDSKMNTYWGEKDVKVYTKTESSAKTTSYVAYEAISFETTVEDGDNLFIYMLKDSDFMKKDKVDSPKTFKLSMVVTGSGTVLGINYNITGNMSSETVDQTGTANKTRVITKMYMGAITISDEDKTSWSLKGESKENDYGTKTGTSTITTTWGSLETDVYSKTDGDQTSTTYVYKDVLPIKVIISQQGETPMEISVEFDGFEYDGKKIESKADLDDLINGSRVS